MKPSRRSRLGSNPAGSPSASDRLVPKIGHETPSVLDVLQKSADASERWAERFSPRVQAQLMIGAGMLLTAITWALGPVIQALPASSAQSLRKLVFAPLAAGPALLVYGILRWSRSAEPTVAPGSGFDHVLVQAEAEERWKHRLLAIAISIMHAMVYMAMH